MGEDIVPDRHLETPYPLYRALEMGIPLKTLLVAGRWLQFSHEHDAQAQEHMHMYRRVLETYDPQTQTVLLSKKGSRRLRQELDTPDRKFSLEEIESDNDLNDGRVKSSNHDLF